MAAVFLGIGMMVMAGVSLNMTLTHSVTYESAELEYRTEEIAVSGASQAIARIKEGGILEPVSGVQSGGGVAPVWVSFSTGEFLYYSIYDIASESNLIRCWGRVAIAENPSSCSVAPDDPNWDGTGWLVSGFEIAIKGNKFFPEAPAYFGNGGIQRPMGGFEWAAGVDPLDPTTWVPVVSNPHSTQASTVPFELSALNHPIDYLYGGGGPEPASTHPHPYPLWGSQNGIAQMNIEAWFQNSAGAGADPTVGLTPAPTATYYDLSDPESPGYPFEVDPNTPDVATIAQAFWQAYKDDANTNLLGTGVSTGTFGDLTNPQITIATGQLLVPPGQTFKGAGVLIIRDNYDPNVDTNNTPGTKAQLTVRGTFEWTGLVIVAGWNPWIEVKSGGNSTIVGSLFGEDTVQSQGEISLDSSAIIFDVQDSFRILYSAGLFEEGGLINPFLPSVNKEIIGVKDL